MRITEQDGVFFTEGAFRLPILGRLEVRAATQNSTLFDLKKEMAQKALVLGGNGVMNFHYSQRADKPLKNVFSLKWDTERLVATGDVVSFDEDPREIS